MTVNLYACTKQDGEMENPAGLPGLIENDTL
jgi:hypothetical protein